MVIQIHKSKKDDQVPAQKKKGGVHLQGQYFQGGYLCKYMVGKKEEKNQQESLISLH